MMYKQATVKSISMSVFSLVPGCKEGEEKYLVTWVELSKVPLTVW